jgi:hypothetical protein
MTDPDPSSTIRATVRRANPGDLDAMRYLRLFGPWFRGRASWQAWEGWVIKRFTRQP